MNPDTNDTNDLYLELIKCQDDELAISDYLLKHNFSKATLSSFLYKTMSKIKYKDPLLFVDQLLKHGADSMAPGTFGISPFVLAVRYKNIPLFELFICYQTGQNKEIISKALLEAAYNGLNTVVVCLLELDPDIDYQGSNDSSTSLMYAARHGHYDVVRTLIGAGASLNKHNDQGKTALMFAMQNNYLQITAELLQFTPRDVIYSSSLYLTRKHSLAFHKLFRYYKHKVEGMALFRVFLKDIARLIYDWML